MPDTRNSLQFFTPEIIVAEQLHAVESTRGRLLIASCQSGTMLARRIVQCYRDQLDIAGSVSDIGLLTDVDHRFSDTETSVRLDHDVSGHDVFLVQSLLDPTSERSVDENYIAFLIAARAFREWGATHVTAVLPYLAYARQDKPTEFKREPTTVKLMAELALTAGIDRLVTWEPHAVSIHGFYERVPVDRLVALPLFLKTFERFRGRDDVIAVAPDAGASKLITHFARALEVNTAITSKFRPQQEQAVVTEIIGDFSGKRIAIVIDDMISSGGTIDALVRTLVEQKGIEEIYLAVSHNLCTQAAYERLTTLHECFAVKQFMVTSTIPQTEEFASLPFIAIHDVSDTLCRVINRIHYNRPVSEIFYHGN
jgi:ribose-phosphate pyrophosphokinase